MADVAQKKVQDKIQEIVEAQCGPIKEVVEQIKDQQAAHRSELSDLLAQRKDAVTRSKSEAAAEQRLFASRMIRCIGAAKGNVSEAINVAKRMGDETVAKALGTTTLAGGAVMIDAERAGPMVDFLRDATVVMELGARSVDMPSGQGHFGRVSTGAVAAYRGESVNAAVSEPTFEEVEPRARILDVLCPASNQLLERASESADQFIIDDLSAACRAKQDATFLRSDGSANKPKGMLYWAKASNKFNASNAATGADGSTIAEIAGDLGQAIRILMDRNIRMVTPGWVFSNRTWQKLFTAREDGKYVWQDELRGGTLYGIPWRATHAVPNNLSGAGSADSEVYLADFFDLVMFRTKELRVSTSTEAAYNPGSGLVSAFQRGETVIKVELEHDFVARRGGSEIVVIQQVRWAE